MRVESQKMTDESVGGYAVSKRKVKIIDNDEIVWKGVITDAGSGQYGDYENGNVKSDKGYKTFRKPIDICRHFGIPHIDEIILGTERFKEMKE